MMSDQGSASASGGSSSSANLNNLFADASLGDALSGGSGDLFGSGGDAGGGPDLSSLFADAGQGVAAAYRPGPVAEPDPRHRGLYDDMYARYLALTGSKEAGDAH